MTTNDSRSTAERSPFPDDELEVSAEDQAYTPPPTETRPDEPVPVQVLDPPADPTPPDVAPQSAPADEPVDTRPDVPRDLDGDPTDFEPLRVPSMTENEPPPDLDRTPDETFDETPPQPVVTDDRADRPADADRWQAIQVRFVDDPSGAVAEAAELVEEAVAALRNGFDPSDTTGGSTEALRKAFRHYRDVHKAVTTPQL